MNTRPLETRFWEKVQKTEGCWLWTASTQKGYGAIQNKGLKRAHRVSWEMAYGKIPQGLCVLHRCDTRRCVRPDHLFLGTAYDNVHDAINKGRLDPAANARFMLTPQAREKILASRKEAARNRTHCPHGHPYSGENLYIRPDGSRECRECIRLRDRIRYADGRHVRRK